MPKTCPHWNLLLISHSHSLSLSNPPFRVWKIVPISKVKCFWLFNNFSPIFSIVFRTWVQWWSFILTLILFDSDSLSKAPTDLCIMKQTDFVFYYFTISEATYYNGLYVDAFAFCCIKLIHHHQHQSSNSLHHKFRSFSICPYLSLASIFPTHLGNFNSLQSPQYFFIVKGKFKIFIKFLEVLFRMSRFSFAPLHGKLKIITYILLSENVWIYKNQISANISQSINVTKRNWIKF